MFGIVLLFVIYYLLFGMVIVIVIIILWVVIVIVGWYSYCVLLCLSAGCYSGVLLCSVSVVVVGYCGLLLWCVSVGVIVVWHWYCVNVPGY